MASQPWKSIRKTLVCNLQGKPFTESGFRSNWHRLMQAGLKGRKKTNGAVDFEPVIKEAFTFHDLRAKSGSDAADVQEANGPLAHDDPMTADDASGLPPEAASSSAGSEDGNVRRESSAASARLERHAKEKSAWNHTGPNIPELSLVRRV
jgi:hypothetical protein